MSISSGRGIIADMRDVQYDTGEYDMDNGAFPHEYGDGLIPSIAPRYAKFTTDWGNGSFCLLSCRMRGIINLEG